MYLRMISLRSMLFFFLFGVIACASQAKSNVVRAGSSAAGEGIGMPRDVSTKRKVYEVVLQKNNESKGSSSAGGKELCDVSVLIARQIYRLELLLKNHVIHVGARAGGKVERAPVLAACHREGVSSIFEEYDILGYLLSVEEIPPSAVNCVGPGEEFLFKRWIRLYYQIIEICCSGIEQKKPVDGKDLNAIAKNCLKLAKIMVDQIENEGSVPEYLVYLPRLAGRIGMLDLVLKAIQLGFSNYDSCSIETVLVMYTTILHEEAALVAKEGCFVFPATYVIPATYCYMGVNGTKNFRANSVFYNFILSHCYDNIYKIYKAKGLKESMFEFGVKTIKNYYSKNEKDYISYVFYYRLSFFALSEVAVKFERLYREWYLKYVKIVKKSGVEDDEIRWCMARRLIDDIFDPKMVCTFNELFQEIVPVSKYNLQVASTSKYMISGKDIEGNSIEPSPTLIFRKSLKNLKFEPGSDDHLELLVERRLIQFPGWILLRIFWCGSNSKFYDMYKSVLLQIFWDVLDIFKSIRNAMRKYEGMPDLVFERRGEIECQGSILAGEDIVRTLLVDYIMGNRVLKKLKLRPPGEVAGCVPVYLYDVRRVSQS